MPNYVKCRLTMRGISNAPLFTEDEEKKPYFDFNKIIKMPESLMIESGSMTEHCVVYYLTDRCTLPLRALTKNRKKLVDKLVHNMFGGESWKQEVFNRVLEEVKDAGEEKKDKMYQQGKTYVENYQQYGATTWYEWCTEHWGTKWNACDSEAKGEDVVEFETAWSAPLPIVEQLSRMYPEKVVSIMWADEDTGSNTGEIAYQNGSVAYDSTGNVIAYNMPDNQSSEAYNLYVELWGESNCLSKDADGNWQHNDCETCHGCD